MQGIDVNCFAGHWPFRRIRKKSFEDLVRIHTDNEIKYGLVSSLNAIFYNDPFEGDQELFEEIQGTEYRLAATLNPMLVQAVEDVDRCIKQFSAAAVRIYPGVHGYDPDQPCLLQLCEALSARGLPLLYTARMEDERLEYLFHSTPFDAKAAAELALRFPKLPILYTCCRSDEIQRIVEAVGHSGKVYFDTSGLKNNLFAIDKILKVFQKGKNNADSIENRLLFGSQFPLFCLKSTLLKIQHADCSQEQKQALLYENVRSLFQ